MKCKTTLFDVARMPASCRRFWMAVLSTALMLFASRAAQAQTAYFGNSLTNSAVTNGGADGIPPLVILGEYNPVGPLSNSTVTLPAGTVQDVKFYGQNYNFTLYALADVGPGPHTNEQTFQVVASQTFSGSPGSPAIQTLAISNFTVNAGNLLAFAGTGPYYAQPPTTNGQDATYEDAANPGSYNATPPGGPGSEFTVGVYGDTNATYEYISSAFTLPSRTYGIGVDVAESSPSNQFLPVYHVTQAGATLSQAMQLANYLNIPTNMVGWSNGWTYYIDPSNYLAVPTVPITNVVLASNLLAVTKNPYPATPIRLEAFDFGAISNMSVFDTNAALNVASNALLTAGLTPEFGTPVIGHHLFVASMSNGSNSTTSVHQYIDTEVNYLFSIPVGTNSYPLAGQGAQAQFVFGPTGNVTRLTYEACQLTEGPSVKIISPMQASNTAVSFFQPGTQIGLQLVYSVPPFGPLHSTTPSVVIPYYAATAMLIETNYSSSNQVVSLGTQLIPATSDTNYVPSISLSASAVGTNIVANATVSGGTPPYTYTWEAAYGPGVYTNTGASITYNPVVRVLPPMLNVATEESNNLINVSWPYPSTGFVLQRASSLVPPINWVTVTNDNNDTLGTNFACLGGGTNCYPTALNDAIHYSGQGPTFYRLSLASNTLPVTETVTLKLTDANGVSSTVLQELQASAWWQFHYMVGPGQQPTYAIEAPYDDADMAGFISYMTMETGSGPLYNRGGASSLPGDFIEPSPQGTSQTINFNATLSGDVTGNQFGNQGFETFPPTVSVQQPPIQALADVPLSQNVNGGINNANLVVCESLGTANFTSSAPDPLVGPDPMTMGPNYQINFTYPPPLPAGGFVSQPPGLYFSSATDSSGFPAGNYLNFNVAEPEFQDDWYFFTFNPNQSWGDQGKYDNLEWLCFFTPSLLQYNLKSPSDLSTTNYSTGFYAWQVWTNNFNGLHALMGYGGPGTTVAADQGVIMSAPIVGSGIPQSFAVNLFPFTANTPYGVIQGPLTIVQAWMSSYEQVVWLYNYNSGVATTLIPGTAALGLVGSGGETDYNDYYPGQGLNYRMGGDILPSQATGFWYIFDSVQINIPQ